MSAGPKETVWPAEPHTIAKIDILEGYLMAYFQILGRSRPKQKLLYVDGFAGPNRYTNHTYGSPTAALNAARIATQDSSGAWVAGQIEFAFVEQDTARYRILLDQLSPVDSQTRQRIHTYNMEFTRALPQIKRDVPEPFRTDSPLFVFIDPFGATGAPFSSVSVAEILNSPCSEVLINLDADGVSRIFSAKQSVNHEVLLDEIFGGSSWKAALHDHQNFDAQCREVLRIYKDKLRTLPGVRYIFEVEMQGKSRTLNYFLVFASKHPLGLIKMKEAMRRISHNGTYRFADADVGQIALFSSDESQNYHMKLYDMFKGQKVAYDSQDDDITAFALNDTPFVNAKAMLTLLEKEGLVTAVSADPKRKKGAFNEAVTAINFHGRAIDGFLF